jgi:hypothetical protein
MLDVDQLRSGGVSPFARELESPVRLRRESIEHQDSVGCVSGLCELDGEGGSGPVRASRI